MGTFDRVAASVRAQEAICVVTVLDSGAAGAKMLVYVDQPTQGTLGLGTLDARIEADARQALHNARSETRSYALAQQGPGETAQVSVFFESLVPPPVLIIVGAGHTSIPLSAFARLCGFKVILVDARAAFATRDRFTDVDEILVAWPHEALSTMRLDDNTHVAVLTHDPKFEEPLLPVLLRSRARYIGVIGSRKTQVQRRERLREEGFSAEDVRRLSGPIGLDIGAVTPEEIALSIMAEIVARQHGRPGGFLGERFATPTS